MFPACPSDLSAFGGAILPQSPPPLPSPSPPSPTMPLSKALVACAVAVAALGGGASAFSDNTWKAPRYLKKGEACPASSAGSCCESLIHEKTLFICPHTRAVCCRNHVEKAGRPREKGAKEKSLVDFCCARGDQCRISWNKEGKADAHCVSPEFHDGSLSPDGTHDPALEGLYKN